MNFEFHLSKKKRIIKVEKKYLKCLKFVVLAAALPFIYGCGGAGVGSLVSFLFGGGLGSAGDIALLGGSLGAGLSGAGGASLASLNQPEPASILLVGSGIMAMSYFKSKTNHRSK